MWPELVLIFGSPVTLLSNTEPTFKKGSLIPSHKTCEPTSPESRDLSARLHIYSFQKLFILFLYGCVGSSLLVWLSSSCKSRSYSLVAVLRLFIAVVSLVVEHGF